MGVPRSIVLLLPQSRCRRKIINWVIGSNLARGKSASKREFLVWPSRHTLNPGGAEYP